jgi:hypothetical protein
LSQSFTLLGFRACCEYQSEPTGELVDALFKLTNISSLQTANHDLVDELRSRLPPANRACRRQITTLRTSPWTLYSSSRTYRACGRQITSLQTSPRTRLPSASKLHSYRQPASWPLPADRTELVTSASKLYSSASQFVASASEPCSLASELHSFCQLVRGLRQRTL